MNVALYFICLVLLLPLAGIATFGFLIDSLANFGPWEVIKMLFAPLYDPLGKGIWIILLLLGRAWTGSVGFFPAARAFGFGAIALIGVLCGAYVVRVYPNDWSSGSVILFIPSLASVVLSVYCVVRPLR